MGFPSGSGLIGVRGRDQWLHCSFGAGGTASLALEGDVVMLKPLSAPFGPPPAPGPLPRRRGMALDRVGRLYRADPAGGGVMVRPLARAQALRLEAPAPAEPLPDAARGPAAPQALAVTGDDHLLVIGEGEARVHVYDLLARRYVGAHDLPRQPLDLAISGGRVHVLLEAPSGWLAFSLCHRPQALSWPERLEGASRLAFSGCGRAFVLVDGGSAEARVLPLGRPRRGIAPEAAIAAPGAREIAVLRGEHGPVLALAAGPGEPIRRILVSEGSVGDEAPLDGRLYDGGGILATPDGHIVFEGIRGGSDLGPLRAAAAARRFLLEGEAILYRLDSGAPANRWGRVFLDACLPEGSAARLSLRTTDGEDDEPAAPRVPPAGLAAAPALPGAALAVLPSQQALDRAEEWRGVAMLRAGAGEGHFATYEAPVLAPPGRYLWLRIALTGRGSTTPRLRRVMAERRGHDWLKHLPRALARRDGETEDFLQALLTPTAAMLAGADQAAAERHRLFDPAVAPADTLPWLGETLGLPVEPEWPESVARRMLAEATTLLRRRGTPEGLARMLEILTGATVSIVESFRLRSGGGVGGEDARSSMAVVGAGFRVGGGLDEDETALDPRADSGIAAHAHRFTVLVHDRLTAAAEQAARRLLDRHRPAHTLYTVCSVDAGLRVGIGGLVGITSILGPSSGLTPAVVGSALIGKGTLIARGGLSPQVFGEEGP